MHSERITGKKLREVAFYLILFSILASFVLVLISAVRGPDLSVVQDQPEITEEMIKAIEKISLLFSVISLIIHAIFSTYFIFRLVKNRKSEDGQGYITFIFVLAIIFGSFAFLGLLTGAFSRLISLTVAASAITGCALQKAYRVEELEEEEEEEDC